MSAYVSPLRLPLLTEAHPFVSASPLLLLRQASPVASPWSSASSGWSSTHAWSAGKAKQRNQPDSKKRNSWQERLDKARLSRMCESSFVAEQESTSWSQRSSVCSEKHSPVKAVSFRIDEQGSSSDKHVQADVSAANGVGLRWSDGQASYAPLRRGSSDPQVSRSSRKLST